jgi:hypothetical protein
LFWLNCGALPARALSLRLAAQRLVRALRVLNFRSNQDGLQLDGGDSSVPPLAAGTVPTPPQKTNASQPSTP